MSRNRLLRLLMIVAWAATGCVTLPGQGPTQYGTGESGPSSPPDTTAGQDKSQASLYTLPDIRPGVRPPLHTDEAGLWMMMDKVEEKLKTSGNLVRDPKINGYVRGIVCRLAGPYCKDIRTYVVRVPVFNATMAPNGVMQVWTGLILRTRNEAQLATVLGHEIGHYLRRHSVQGMRDAIAASNFLIFFQMAAAYAGVPVAGDVAGLVAIGALLAYNRDHEREADAIGHRLLVENGLDPREAPRIWDQLIRERDADDDSTRPPLFLSTHPPSDERSETLTRLGNEAIGDGPPGEIGRTRFLEVFLPHRKSFLRDDLRVGNFPRTLELLEMLRDDGENLAELNYFEGEVYRLRKKKGDLEKALEAYSESLNLDDPPPEIHRSMGLVFSKLDRKTEARASFRRYLELMPDAEDNMMIRHLLGTMS
ncbi:MAG: M48 family metalloprotease [Rhodospirillales bacterium]